MHLMEYICSRLGCQGGFFVVGDSELNSKPAPLAPE